MTAVVVTYQSLATVGATIASARTCHEADLLDLVIVDNGSRDGTADLLSRDAAWAQLILSKRNVGFGRGCNLGATSVTSKYTLFLNPDAAIEPAAVRQMLDFMEERPTVGITGPATLCGEEAAAPVYQLTSPLSTPWTVILCAMPFIGHRFVKLRPIVPNSAPFRTGWVSGAIFMIRTDLLRRLQGFDPRFFLYWEETDLCKRAADLGFETWAVGSAVARHICGASSPDDDTRTWGCIGRHYFQSRRYYMIKHHGWLAATIAEVGEFLLLSLRTAWDVVKGRGASRIRPRLQAALFSQPDAERP